MSTNSLSQAIVPIIVEGRKLYSEATRGCAGEEKYDYSMGSKVKDSKTLLEEATREFRF